METNKLGLPGKEICRIIKVCQKSRVLNLELGDMKISFQVQDKKVATKEIVVTTEKSEAQVSENVEGASKEIEAPKSLLTQADDDAYEEARRAQLMVDNPAEWEALMVDDHMNRPSRMRVNEATGDRRT